MSNYDIVTLHICPNGCGGCFDTTAHIMQSWKVDATGAFVEVLENCIQTTHGPDNDNIWTCVKCGAEALQVQCRRAYSIIQTHEREKQYNLFFPVQDTATVYWQQIGCHRFKKAVIEKAADGRDYINADGTPVYIERP